MSGRASSRGGAACARDLTYTYDPVGNVARITDAAQQPVFFANTVVSPDRTFAYDALYRLVEATGREHASVLVHAPHGGVVWEVGQGMQWRDVPAANDTSGTGALVAYTEAFAYDHAGNLLTTSHTGTVNWTRTQSYATASNRLATSVDSNGTSNATHDAFGNMLAMPGLDVMQWDAFGNLHRTSADDTAHGDKTFYVHDAAGQRVRKVTEKWDSSLDTHVRTSDTLYLGGFELVRTWTGTTGTTLANEIETLHVMDADARLAIVETQTVEAGDPPTPVTPKWRYQLDDLIGSSAVELGRDGQVISYEEFHAYGTTALLIDTGGEGFRKRYRWSGKERDAESGLVYFGARYFAPWLGRWASADPAGAVDGNPYRVVRGNPVGLREVDGRQAYWSTPERGPDASRDGAINASESGAEEFSGWASTRASAGTPPPSLRDPRGFATEHPGGEWEPFSVGQALELGMNRLVQGAGDAVRGALGGQPSVRPPELHGEKLGFVAAMREPIRAAAATFELPMEVVAGVAYAEYGGKDPIKGLVQWGRGTEVLGRPLVPGDQDATSRGPTSMQIRRAAETLGMDPTALTDGDRDELVDILSNPAMAVYVTAAHLSDLRDRFYPGAQAHDMTEGAMIRLLTRYQRGPDISSDALEQDLHYGEKIFRGYTGSNGVQVPRALDDIMPILVAP